MEADGHRYNQGNMTAANEFHSAKKLFNEVLDEVLDEVKSIRNQVDADHKRYADDDFYNPSLEQRIFMSKLFKTVNEKFEQQHRDIQRLQMVINGITKIPLQPNEKVESTSKLTTKTGSSIF